MIAALVSDLMDRSRLQGIDDLSFVRAADECRDADVVIVDLARYAGDIAAIRLAAPHARIVAFGPHVDEQAMQQARAHGADDVMPRSKFFRDPASHLA